MASRRVSFKRREAFRIEREEDPKWYAMSTFGGLAVERLKRKMKVDGLGDDIREVFFPSRMVDRVKRGKRVKVEEFPLGSYFFIRAKMSAHLFWNAREVGGLVWLNAELMPEERSELPQPVPEEEVMRMKYKMSEQKVFSDVDVEEGDQVAILVGPFQGLAGYIKSLVPSELGTVANVEIEIFGRPTRVGVPAKDLEKI